MHFPALSMIRLFIPACGALIAACGGGGGGGTTSLADNTRVQDAAPVIQQLTYAGDIAPIVQAKCIGCHNAGDNPLAPFSLEGKTRADAFKSAIHFSVADGSMPPVGALPLTTIERAKLLAWAQNAPYDPASEILRVPLIEALAWDVQPKNRDAFIDRRPDDVDCPRGTGWLVEESELEVRTEYCNYLSLSQQSLLSLPAATQLELVLSHSALNFNAPANAHIAISIAGSIIWETTIAIPSGNNILKETLNLPIAIQAGDPIEFHLQNHGDNAYTFHSLDALVSSDEELTYCPSYDSTFEAIQAVVFEQAGCANSLCHGDATAGGLDLSPGVAWENIVAVRATGSSLLLVDPRKPAESYLYHKLSAKTFPGSYDIAGAEMPSAGPAISAGQLEALRLWIEAGAPRQGSVGDTLGRGEDELERLLGVCLPEAEAINTTPLPPPPPEKGVQLAMPPHDVLAEDEREICFAVYEDFRDVIPAEYLDESGDHFFLASGETREDAFTHHNLVYQALVGVEDIHHPSFGEWTCVGGGRNGETCEPTDLASCGTGKCRSEMKDSIACRGFGPPVETGDGGILGLGSGPDREGFYSLYPSHGIFYWNSHAFNLTTEDGVHHVWRNLHFADDRRFRAARINEISSITAGAGTPAFGKKTVCRDYVFDQGDGLLSLNSHTHKRGERFFMKVGDELVYETFTYDEPLNKVFEPALVFNSPDPAERTLTYCATYNNGVNADGSPNVEIVTRLSRRPENAFPCRPTACVAGNVGAPCAGRDDNASCDSSPGAGDGWCDACVIQPGVSSDDEMFIALGSKLPDHDALMSAHSGHGRARVRIDSPASGDIFAPGDAVPLAFGFMHFDLVPPEDHGGHGHGDVGNHDGDHNDPGGEHGHINEGHYHIYLDTDDDGADHITDWAPRNTLVLPADIASGPHEIRISLRAPDHHAVGAEARVTIQVE
ncbi:MAG: hypothetical protein HRT77_02310 [Halioglobus sp.]|nr:hypothetical protein [Halioglobus sp.]